MENQKKKLFGLITLNKYGNPFKRKLFIFFMLLIPIANFLVFTVYANFGGIVLSFRQMSNSTGQEVFVGIANYKKFFEEFELMQYGRMILVSFGYLFVVMFLSLPISLLCSFFLYKRFRWPRSSSSSCFCPISCPRPFSRSITGSCSTLLPAF